MKKAFMLVAAIAMLAAPVFAIDFNVSGEVSATFGADLNNGATGFENGVDMSVEIPLIDAGSSTTLEGDADVYASITVEDFSLDIDNGGLGTADDDDSVNGTITGKIHFGDMFIGVYNTPDVDKNLAENFGFSKAAGVNNMDFNNDTAYLGATGGMSLGFDNGDHAIEFSVSSVNDWDADVTAGVAAIGGTQFLTATSVVAAKGPSAVNWENKYVFALDAGLDFGAFDLDAYAMMANGFTGYTGEMYIGFGVAPSFEMDFTETMGMEIVVGSDFVVVPAGYTVADGNGIYMDFAPELVLNLTAENDDEDRTNLTVGAYIATSTAKVMTDNANMQVNLQAVFTEEHDGGFVDGLGSEVTFKMLNLADYAKATTDYMTWALDLSVDYDIMDGLTPSAGFGYGTDNHKFNLDAGLELGEDFTGIANTTFNVDYTSSSLAENTAKAVTVDKGVLTLKTTLSF